MKSVSETSVCLNFLTRLAAREDFTGFYRHENFKTYQHGCYEKGLLEFRRGQCESVSGQVAGSCEVDTGTSRSM